MSDRVETRKRDRRESLVLQNTSVKRRRDSRLKMGSNFQFERLRRELGEGGSDLLREGRRGREPWVSLNSVLNTS